MGDKVQREIERRDGGDGAEGEATHQPHAPDSRRFEAAAEILQDLGIASVSLMSNNPIKLLALQQQGLEVVQREPHEIDANPENAAYLATKREKMGHLLALSASPASSPASRSRR